ncbi:MAG: sulfite exporter TauE/SafE family protein [Chloroflexota bacterium]
MPVAVPATLIFAVGVAASLVNIMAGGGSVLTLGAMTLLGLDGAVANGTNRIGLLVESLAGVGAFRAARHGEMRTGLVLGLCAVPGALLGALVAVRIGNALFQRLLAMVMILVLATLFAPKPASPAETPSRRSEAGPRRWLIYPVMVLIGLYGGFIQAGVGFLIMAALRHILRLDLVTVNRHKTTIVLVYTLPALAVFLLTGHVHPLYAASLAAGNGLGAWLGVRLAIRRGERAVKLGLAAAVVLMAARLFVATP